MEDSLSSLLCTESVSSLKGQYARKDENLDLCSVSHSDSEYVEMLIQKETVSHSNHNTSSVGDWLHRARADSIKWILDTSARFGFGFRTAYLSLIYFDRFFSRRSIDNGQVWAIQLLSIACLSLAAKMEECEVPALSEYNMEEFNFHVDVIQRMELLVLNALEWKMIYPTPFVYLDYFTTKLYGDLRHRELINRAVELILAVLTEINVVEHKPSIIAAAVVLAAYDDQLTKKTLEIKINAIPSWGALEKEHTFCCYSLLQEIGLLKSKALGSMIIAPTTLSTHSNSIVIYDDDDHHHTPIAYEVGKKRSVTCINDEEGSCQISKSKLDLCR